MRRLSFKPVNLRASARIGIAGLCLLTANSSHLSAVAADDTRTLSFHNLHTGEDVTVTYKRNGRFDEAALKKLDWFMRDWRKEETTRMDPQLYDILWEAYREVGATQPINVICGYRSPATNAMLRARSNGVAENSRHTHGQAMDFAIPGVPLEKLRNVGLRLQRGGVGFYPSSGSPFVHLDTGNIRHWPRLTYAQLSKVFPDGRTVHIPSDGQPLPGYALALADVERRGKTPNGVSLAAARDAGVITASQEEQAESIAANGKPKRSLWASLFNFGSSRQDAEEAATSAPAAPKRARMATASLAAPKAVTTERIPLPTARPSSATQIASAQPNEGTTFENRGVWLSDQQTEADAPAKQPPFNVATAEPLVTGSTGALAYSGEAKPEPAARARPMGKTVPQLSREAKLTPGADAMFVVTKTPPMAIGGQHSGSPWMRAAILTPSVSGFMTMTRTGALDPRWLKDLLHKPAQALTTGFSSDPSTDMLAHRFSGKAVVFLATATFSKQRTAALR